MDVRNSKYAEWLEGLIKYLLEHQPEKIGVCAIVPDGNVLTGFYGDCTPQDKAVMAYHIHTDAVFDTIKANAREVIEAAEDQEEMTDSEREEIDIDYEAEG